MKDSTKKKINTFLKATVHWLFMLSLAIFFYSIGLLESNSGVHHFIGALALFEVYVLKYELKD